MKLRILAFVLALLLIALPAMAETREGAMEINGGFETVTETKYENPIVGFAFWFDASAFTILWDSLQDVQGQLMVQLNTESGVPAYVTAELPGKYSAGALEFLNQKPILDGVDASAISAVQTAFTEGAASVSYVTAHDDTTAREYFAIEKGDKALVLYATWAADDAAAAARINHLVSTFDLK